MRIKRLKLRAFIQKRADAGEDLAPSLVMEEYNRLTNQEKSLQSVSQMLKRMSLDKTKRAELVVEKAKLEAGRDILEYAEYKNYVVMAEQGRVQQKRIKTVAKNLRFVWELMNQTDPHTWQFENLIERLRTKYPMVVNEKDQKVYEHPAQVLAYLGAVNTVFKGIIPENFSADLSRKKGELKDYLTFDEFWTFITQCQTTPELNVIGWRTLFCAQINGGFREGTQGKNGILGLQWENINFQTKRCRAHEKGGRGNASRVWENIPLDLFPWIHGWDRLLEYWTLLGKPTAGRVFPVNYNTYLEYFHKTRHACNGRIAGEKETFRPHIFRKTHAQWLRKLRVPLEIIAGAFPQGLFGVGWDNISVLKEYYVTIEPDEYEEAQKKADERMKSLGLS